jgi:hypothetical protein
VRIGTLIALETPTKPHKSRFAKVRWYLVLELRKCLIKAGVDVPGLRKEMERIQRERVKVSRIHRIFVADEQRKSALVDRK